MGFQTRIPLDDVTLVLGGGGGRGLAHIGAWRALQELGIHPVRIVGCSAGALIGACIAAGASWRDLASRAQLLAGGVFSLNGRVLSQGMRTPSLLREEPLRELIHSLSPARHVGDLPLPLSVNAVDLATGQVIWFGEGGRHDVPLADAVYASCALPLFFPPAAIGGEQFIDGGILDPLPVARARALGARAIIAVDLATPAGPAQRRPGMIDTYCRVLEILQERRGSGRPVAPGRDLVHIHPALPGRHTFDLSRPESLVEAGYHSALDALSGTRTALDGQPTWTASAPAAVKPPRGRWLSGWLQSMPAALGRLAPSR